MLSREEVKELERFALSIRKETITAIYSCGGGHIGGAMSMVEALAVLYGKYMRVDPKNPR